MDPTLIDSIETLNEHDYNGACLSGGPPNQWAIELQTFQKSIWNTVKSLQLPIAVVGPSLVYGLPSAQSVGDLTPWMDYANFHPYPGGAVPEIYLKPDVESLLPMNGAKTYLATESGYHNFFEATGNQGVSERAVARYLPRLYFEFFNFGIKRSYSYEFVDEDNLVDAEAHCGLLHGDGTEKPAYQSIKNLFVLLSDPNTFFTPGSWSYTLAGATSTIHHTLLQKQSGDFDLVLWQDVSVFDLVGKQDVINASVPVTLTWNDDPHTVSVYDVLQNPPLVQSFNAVQTISLQVGDAPLIVEIHHTPIQATPVNAQPVPAPKIYPNPWRSDKNSQSPMIFDALPLGSHVDILNIASRRVTTLDGTSGRATWNISDQTPASGIYFYLIKTPSSSTPIRGKIAILR